MVPTEKATTDQKAAKQSKVEASSPGIKKYLVYFIAFWAIAIMAVLVVRYPVILGLLLSGNNDRSLLAVESATIDDASLTVNFMRGVPDQPTELFILNGAFPKLSSSDTNKLNRVDKGNVFFNDEAYEVLHRAMLIEGITELSADKYSITWVNQERGEIKLGQLGDSLVEHIKAGKAFLLVSNGENVFAAAALK